MSITASQPDRNAERVCIHKWAFTTALTISLGAGFTENTIPTFSRNDAITLSKYNRQNDHQHLIRQITESSHGTSSFPFMICSIVSAQ
jgi:hypothetical protein